VEQQIAKSEILNIITEQETDLELELDNFWRLINIIPEYWEADSYGQKGKRFWVVGICGKAMIWYNDIENGFNLGTYDTYGKIENYTCNRYELRQLLWQLYNWRNYPKRIATEPTV
jgi:hypothetical protein